MDKIPSTEAENADPPNALAREFGEKKKPSLYIRSSSHFLTNLIGPILVLCVTGFVYLSCLSNHLTEDSANYAHSAITGEGLIHPHHLLYNPMLRAVVMILPGASIDVLITAFQLTNILLTMMASAIFCLIIKSIGAPRWASVIYALFFAFSYGMLAYSSQIEVYNVTVLFLTLAVYGLLRTDRSGWRLVLIVFGWSAALLFHQTAIFFGAAIIVFEMMHKETRSVRQLVCMVGIPLVVVGMIYLITGWSAGCRNLGEYWHWITSYAYTGNWGKGSLSTSTISMALGGMVKALIGIRPKLLFILLFIFLGLHILGQLLFDFRHTIRNRIMISAFLLWFVLQAIFNGWWYGRNPEFWISALIPLIIILGAIAYSRNGRRSPNPLKNINPIPIVAATLLLALSAYFHYQANKRVNVNKLRIEQCGEYAREPDTIVTAGTDLLEYYRLYYGRSHILAINDELAIRALHFSDSTTFTQALLDALAQEVLQTQQHGGTVFVDQRIFQNDLQDTRHMKDFDSKKFSDSLHRQFKVVPVKSDTASFWSVLTFSMHETPVPDPAAGHGASSNADKLYQ